MAARVTHIISAITEGKVQGHIGMSCTSAPMSEPPPALPNRCGGDECESCGTTEDVACGPCPYAEDVHGDSTPVLKCVNCRNEAARDI